MLSAQKFKLTVFTSDTSMFKYLESDTFVSKRFTISYVSIIDSFILATVSHKGEILGNIYGGLSVEGLKYIYPYLLSTNERRKKKK